jgi:hypothetical protein
MRFKLVNAILISMLLSACDKGAPAPTSTAGKPPPAASAAVAATPAISSDFTAAKIDGNATTPGGACNFDLIDGKDREAASFTVAQAAQVRFVGWAVLSAPEGVVGDGVMLALTNADGARYLAPTNPDNRPDVATFLDNARLAGAGFLATPSMLAVPKGKYKLSIMIKNGASLVECGIVKQMVVE